MDSSPLYEAAHYHACISLSADEAQIIIDALPEGAVRRQLIKARQDAIDRADANNEHEEACDRIARETPDVEEIE